MPTKTPRDWKKEIQSDGKPHYNVVWDKVFSFPIGGGYDAKGDEYLVKLLERDDALKMVTFIENLLEEARQEMREKCIKVFKDKTIPCMVSTNEWAIKKLKNIK